MLKIPLDPLVGIVSFIAIIATIGKTLDEIGRSVLDAVARGNLPASSKGSGNFRATSDGRNDEVRTGQTTRG